MNNTSWQETYKNAYQRTQAIWGKSGTHACKHSIAFVASNLFSSQGALRQEFIFSRGPIKPEGIRSFRMQMNHVILPIRLTRTNTDDGDVEGENNYINIPEYVALTEEIKGIFQVTFVIQRIASEHHLPDTIRFTEGRFHTKFVYP